eukprot:1460023-Alexandrium_andersonii.AAC.1
MATGGRHTRSMAADGLGMLGVLGIFPPPAGSCRWLRSRSRAGCACSSGVRREGEENDSVRQPPCKH